MRKRNKVDSFSGSKFRMLFCSQLVFLISTWFHSEWEGEKENDRRDRARGGEREREREREK